MIFLKNRLEFCRNSNYINTSMINTFEQTPTGFVQINLLNKEEIQ